jgi:hypothetical protein
VIKQFLLGLNFILILSLLTGTVLEISDSFVYSFKPPVSTNAPSTQELSTNKSNDQNKAINNNTELNKSNSNLTAIPNETNSSSSLSMNNSLAPDVVDKEYNNSQDSDDEDLADRIFDDVQAQLKAQGIDIPLPYG